MTKYIDHHMCALYSTINASLELLSTQPDTDAMCELRELLEASWDITDCLVNMRHYGSDNLDIIIRECEKVVAQVKEFEHEHKKTDL